ncbi:unnamed protein product [Dibothriocephalus latus]|uniref:Uncharacterized protein n=1 Tax=Dibothriocephalus latus TaxID=60516 RepID=A0A3P7LWB9_DIBLA|nr:unnamed protein product [Dibothriocephalus latus]
MDVAVALKNRGNKFFKAGRYQQAVECYTEALETCPEDSVTPRLSLHPFDKKPPFTYLTERCLERIPSLPIDLKVLQ